MLRIIVIKDSDGVVGSCVVSADDAAARKKELQEADTLKQFTVLNLAAEPFVSVLDYVKHEDARLKEDMEELK